MIHFPTFYNKPVILLTSDRRVAIEVERHTQNHQNPQRKNIRSTSPPAGLTVVTGRSHHWLENETQDGADEPDKAVQALRESNTQQDGRHIRRFHRITKLSPKHGHAVHKEPARGPSGGLHHVEDPLHLLKAAAVVVVLAIHRGQHAGAGDGSSSSRGLILHILGESHGGLVWVRRLLLCSGAALSFQS